MIIEELAQIARREVLDTYRREFDQLATSFRDLDGKAQGTAALAGAFLAATLAFLRGYDNLQDPWRKSIVALILLALGITILFSVEALRVRRLVGPPSGKVLDELLGSILQIPDQAEALRRLHYFYGDVSDLWESCLEPRRSANDRKAARVWAAQVGLVTAEALALILLAMTLLCE